MVTVETAIKKIRKFFISQKRIPTYQEMCYLFGYKSKKAAFDLAQKLILEGVLEKDEKGRLLPKRLFLPLSLYGTIKAGYPQAAESQFVDTISSFDWYLIDNPEGSYLLRVSGDSMTGAGLFDGDIVVIDRDRRPRDRDIVVAFVDNGWTLKYLLHEKGRVVLMPANTHYKPIYPKDSLTIEGVVVSVVRKLH